MTLDARTQAINTLTQVQEGTSLATLLSPHLNQLDDSQKGLYHELVLGTLRHWHAFVRVSDKLSHQPITEPKILAAVHMGMYQLFYLNTPDHAAIGETVEAVKKAGGKNGSGLVNALLRTCQKKFNKISKKIPQNHSLPNWLAKHLKNDWKEHYNALGNSLRGGASIFLRVNNRHISTSDYAQLLTEEGIEFAAVATADNNILRLDSRIAITALPHFDEGFVSVQDLNASRAVSLFDNLDGKVVLDACAAPGGKTAQILENYNVESLLAVDLEPNRTLRIAENLERLGLLADNVELETANINTLPKQEQFIEKFDAILLDAPCTATGVIRRHPDISLLRLQEDVWDTLEIQEKILESAWKMLKKGGQLVYATCSILQDENSKQIANFLAKTANAREIPIEADWGVKQEHGVQCLPLYMGDLGEDDDLAVLNEQVGDGFYYAKLVKLADEHQEK